jgi:hypothetical protein
MLATTGGGGDGARLMSQILAAYEHHGDRLMPLLMVLGPLMPSAERAAFFEQARHLPKVSVIEFDNSDRAPHRRRFSVDWHVRLQYLLRGSVVRQAGLDRAAYHPREEQLIRATRASELGLVDMLLPEQADDAGCLPIIWPRLASRPLPSAMGAGAMLRRPGIDQRLCEQLGREPPQRRPLCHCRGRLSVPKRAS